MNTKLIAILAVMFFELLTVPVVNADVVVRYIVVDDGYSYREPFDYRRGSRLYSNTSRLGNITHSNGSRYRDRCEDDRYYYEPRQYRNNYYYGHQNSRNQRYSDNRGSVYSRDDAHHGYYITPAYPDKHMHSNRGGRVHINIK